ncbi:MAG: type II secretion system F family protein [Huintestinicola sp.]
MNIILLIISTIMLIFWIILSLMSDDEMIKTIMDAKYRSSLAEYKELEQEKRIKLSDMVMNGSDENSFSYRSKLKSYEKKEKEIKKKMDKYSSGKPEFEDIIPSVGYVFIRLIKLDTNAAFYRNLVKDFIRIDSKENAMPRATYLICATFSYAYMAVMCSLALTAVLLNNKTENAGVVGVIIIGIAALLCYIPFDNLKSKIRNRNDSITADFGNVVSKLALLVNSGMEVTKAWELTANSNNGILYDEMRIVVDLQNNNVSPTTAYTNFMNNCNNKYTTKLAVSILQNLSKGNSEIGMLFVQISNESWLEKRHNAKRYGELAQNKMMVPTLLLFVGILVLICVPIAMSFGSVM